MGFKATPKLEGWFSNCNTVKAKNAVATVLLLLMMGVRRYVQCEGTERGTRQYSHC